MQKVRQTQRNLEQFFQHCYFNFNERKVEILRKFWTKKKKKNDSIDDWEKVAARDCKSLLNSAPFLSKEAEPFTGDKEHSLKKKKANIILSIWYCIKRRKKEKRKKNTEFSLRDLEEHSRVPGTFENLDLFPKLTNKKTKVSTK